MTTARDDSPWHDPGHGLTPTAVQGKAQQHTGPDSRAAPPGRAQARDDLLDPRTQIVSNREDYLGQGGHDVGRRISNDHAELFITADVAGSLQREFIQHTPEFVAVHDVGTSASLRLLGSLANAAGGRMQRLSVRRQGHGVALAVLQFVEVPLANGTPVRVYATDLNADAQTRAQVARVLLAHSRLGVLLIGELPPHALTGQLAPLHEALLRGNWPNRDLLMVPLGSGTALAAQAAQLASHSEVGVHVTPHADKPRDAWTFISGAWNRLHGSPGGERTLQTELALAVPRARVPNSEAVTLRMDLRPMPTTVPPAMAAPAAGRFAAAIAAPFAAATAAVISSPAAAPMPMPGTTSWQAYVDRCAQLKGAISCCVFDVHSMQPLAHAGGAPVADRLAQQGAALLANMNEAGRALGLGAGRSEAAITMAGHHLILRPVPGHPGVAVHLVLLASTANLTLTRMQLERIAAPA